MKKPKKQFQFKREYRVYIHTPAGRYVAHTAQDFEEAMRIREQMKMAGSKLPITISEFTETFEI